MSGKQALLIYDGGCGYCRAVARMAYRLDHGQRFTLMAFKSGPAQQVLDAQFGAGMGFTMYLFANGQVYWAQAAAREIVRLLGLPRAMGWVAFRVYPALVRTVSWLTRREQVVCMPGGEGACARNQSSSGSMGITREAAVQLGALAC